MRSTKFWICVIGAILVITSIIVIFQYTQNTAGNTAEIYQNGVLIRTVSLAADTEFTITNADGGYNTIQVKDGAISVIDASCRDKICVHEGAISSAAKPIVCLPNKLVIKVSSAAPSKIDVVVG
jgi:hypothetical protein